MSSPRIIAGKAKGLRLKTLSGNVTRPITDRVKEALFNIIGNDIHHSRFLDLFGGSGSVGLEALSRGANLAVFIEKNTRAYAVLLQNVQKTGLSEQAFVIRGDAFQYITNEKNHVFDYIFIAPPQYQGIWVKTMNILDDHPTLLDDNGWLIVQIDPIEEVGLDLKNFTEFDRRKYGSTLLKFYLKA